MSLTTSSDRVAAEFSTEALVALKAFYLRIPARLIRKHLIDPWPVVERHRALRREEYNSVLIYLLGVVLSPELASARRLPERRRDLVSLKRFPKSPGERWQVRICPYCGDRTTPENWTRSGRFMNRMGFGVDGCHACFELQRKSYVGRVRANTTIRSEELRHGISN